MSYTKEGVGNGVAYIGVVKWGHDYSDVMLFDSADKRNSFFKQNFKKIGSAVYIDQDGSVKVKMSMGEVEKYNYLFFTNDTDITKNPRCCFITNYEFVAPDTTRLYLEVDVFQQFVYQTAFYQSYVERGTVKRSADTVGAYIQPEPFSVKLEFESKRGDILTENDWEPQWVLHAASKYHDNNYEYTGSGTNNTFGEYGFYINNTSDIAGYLKNYGRKSPKEIAQDVGEATGNQKWTDWLNSIFAGTAGTDAVEGLKVTTSVADLQDHRNELIGLYAIPKWAKGSGNEATNERKSASSSINLNASQLANGYTPRNKKMLTSICRAYVILNRNGLQIALKPELFTANSTTITVYAIPMSTSGYQYAISNYKNYSASYGEVPYSSERRVGYDQNTGLNKVLSYVGAVQNIAGAAASVGGQIAAGNVGGAAMALPSLVETGISAVDQIGSQGAGFGSNGDLLRITGGYSHLHFYELNPSVGEAQALDDFFDMYGYAINEIYNINNPNSPVYMKGRSNWNFIKTHSINCRCNCPTQYEDKFKQIFDSGVTIWHTYEHFSDYSQTNN